MASFAALLKEKGKTLNVSDIVVPKIQMIHYQKLKSSKKNFYRQDQIEELADSIELVGMVLQPLIVCKTDMGEYEVLAGHRRMGACIHNVEVKKLKKYEQIPCIEIVAADLIKEMIEEYQEKGMDAEEAMDVFAEYIIIATNSTARGELTDYEKVMQAARLQIIIPIMHGDEALKGRALRAEIAKEMKVSNGTIGNYMNIYNNLVPMGMEMLEYGVLGITMASKICSLDPEVQKELLNQERITDADILRYKNPPVEEETEEEMEEETCSHFPKCYLCNTADCNSRQDERDKCTYDNDKNCNIAKAIKLMYENEPELEKECSGCCMRCDKKANCGYACYNSKKTMEQPILKQEEKSQELEKEYESNMATVQPEAVHVEKKAQITADDNTYTNLTYGMADVEHLLSVYERQVESITEINKGRNENDRVLQKSLIIRDALTAYLRQFES